MQVPGYLFLILFAIIIIVLVSAVKASRAARKLRQDIASRWGKKPALKYKEEEMRAIKYYFDSLRGSEPGRYFLDDITWHDLDMDDVFKRINSTLSSVGEEYLYALLREPVTDEKILAERSRLIELFSTDAELRTSLQYIFARLGKSRFAGVSNYFFSKAEYSPFKRIKYIIMAAVFLLSPLIIAFDPSIGIFVMIASFFTNMGVYYKAKNELSTQLDSLSYMVNMTAYALKAASLKAPGLREYAGRIKTLASKISSTGTKSFYQIFYNTQNELFEYFKIIFLVELIAFEGVNKKVIQHRKELRELYEIVGLLDSMIALASYRASLPLYTTPVLSKKDSGHRPAIVFENIYHPLIDEPVVNSLEINKSVLVTGSNASGKSTFLKTAAVNAIFAQTIDTCLAASYKSVYFRIYTSMALEDNLLSNESYYIAEIKSLKRMLDGLNSVTPLFCIIDEVLRGTNTIERIAASSQLLRYLAGRNCVCLTATHDIELTAILNHQFDNYHFRESFKNNDILFDYKIYPGKSKTRNAIKLLEIMDYPADIINHARNLAERFEQKGSWTDGGISYYR